MKAFILVFIIALGLGLAVRATLAGHRNATAVLALASDHEEFRKKISREQQRLQQIQQASAAASASMTTSDQPKPNHEAATLPASSNIWGEGQVRRALFVPKVSATTVIASDPKLMAGYLREYRNQMLDSGTLGSFRAVGLSSDQIKAMKDLMVEKEQRRMDLLAVVETEGLDQQSDAYKALNFQNEQWRLKRQAEILGDLEPAYREYERTVDVRLGATVLAIAASYTGESVTAAQLEQVTQILVANSERIQSGPKTGFVKEDTVNWNVATGQLKDVLTPSQIEVLRTCYEANVQVVKLEAEINRRGAVLTAEFKKQSGSK